MGATFLVVATGLAIAGYLGYRKLQSIEDEIREELEEPHKEPAAADKAQTGQEGMPPVQAKGGDPIGGLEVLVLEKVRQLPGILQTDLYSAFADRERKELQALLLRMDRDGRLARRKKGSTYEVFPV